MNKVAILVGGTGRGTNMKSLAQSCFDKRVDASVALVISPKENEAIEWARFFDIPVEILSKSEDYAEALLKIIVAYQIDIICLAGYMYLLPKNIIEHLPGRILNIHPSLLPKYGGKGMYGMNVHQAIFDANEIESGCTVHKVNEQYDDGAIVIQKRCTITTEDTPETIAAKVLELEHLAYPEALKLLTEELKQEFIT